MKQSKGRPRKYDSDSVLEAAEKAFSKKGYSGISVDDICHEAGINKSTLYRSFGDKKQIYCVVLERFNRIMKHRIQDIISSEKSFSNAVISLFETFEEIYFERHGRPTGCLVTGTATAEALQEDDIAERARVILDEMDTAFLELAARGQEAGALRSGLSNEAVSRMIATSLHSLGIRARCQAERSIAGKMAKNLIAVLCH